MESIKIKINISGRHYPLTVHPDEEGILREAGKEINAMIQEFENKYAVTDKQDALAMAALQLASRSQLQEQNWETKEKNTTEKLKNLLSLLAENE